MKNLKSLVLATALTMGVMQPTTSFANEQPNIGEIDYENARPYPYDRCAKKTIMIKTTTGILYFLKEDVVLGGEGYTLPKDMGKAVAFADTETRMVYTKQRNLKTYNPGKPSTEIPMCKYLNNIGGTPI